MSPAAAALHLEDAGGDRPAGVAARRGQQGGEPVQQGVDPGPGDGGPEEHRVHQRVPDLPGQLALEPVARRRRVAVKVGAQDGVVVLGERFGQPLVGRVARGEGGRALAEPGHRAHRDDGRRQPPGDVAEQPLVAGAAAVDLVDEEQRRHP